MIALFLQSPFPKWRSSHIPKNKVNHCCINENFKSIRKDLDISSVGNICLDIILPITQYPVQKGEHQSLRSIARMELGGSMNALISARRLGALVAPVAYITDSAGHPSDLFISNYVYDSSARLGICTDGLVRKQNACVQTCAAVLDRNGQHTFLASNEYPMNSTKSDSANACEEMMRTVALSKVLIVDGYAIHSDRQLVLQSLQSAMTSGTNIWVDPQAACKSLLAGKDEVFQVAMTNASGVSMTTDESYVLTKTKDPATAAKSLRSALCPSATIFLIKDGANGSHIVSFTGDNSFEVITAPPFTLDNRFKDSIGAGDAFLGAFLAGRLSLELSLAESGRLANAMGACTCLNTGAGESGIGTMRNVKELLHDIPLVSKLSTEQAEAG